MKEKLKEIEKVLTNKKDINLKLLREITKEFIEAIYSSDFLGISVCLFEDDTTTIIKRTNVCPTLKFIDDIEQFPLSLLLVGIEEKEWEDPE